MNALLPGFEPHSEHLSAANAKAVFKVWTCWLGLRRAGPGQGESLALALVRSVEHHPMAQRSMLPATLENHDGDDADQRHGTVWITWFP